MGISDQSVRLTLRVPELLRDKLLVQARKNMRSMNSEIVAILEASVKGDAPSDEALNRLRPEYRHAITTLVRGLLSGR